MFCGLFLVLLNLTSEYSYSTPKYMVVLGRLELGKI